MIINFNFVIICVHCFVVFVKTQFVGEPCKVNNDNGTCKRFTECARAQSDFRNGIIPQKCSFEHSLPVICCINPPSNTTNPKPDYTDYDDDPDVCPEVSANLTKPKTGRKAWDKCIDYQERLVYPCVKASTLSGGLTRVNYCQHSADELIIGGENAGYGEFPHMALLGFGATPEQASWDCGGTLISEKFILTAGHCTTTRLGDVAYVRLSLLKRTDPINSATKRLYNIARIIKHPDYKPPQKYNDIALLETTTTILLDRFAVPACLHFGNEIRDSSVVALGWGTTKHRGDVSNILQKVKLTKYTKEECDENYSENRNLKQGILDSQICYGDKFESKDTCQGDSGGPIQIKNADIHCMYTIVGVTSFGSGCGYIGVPGVYTKVADYIDWIESVVWP